jgi:hypothetical protein
MTDASILSAESPRNAFVYVAQADDGPLKIGITKDPKNRLRALNTGNPAPLNIQLLLECSPCFARMVEQQAHRSLEAYKIKGEWFTAPLVVAAYHLMRVADEVSGRHSYRAVAVGNENLKNAIDAEQALHRQDALTDYLNRTLLWALGAQAAGALLAAYLGA